MFLSRFFKFSELSDKVLEYRIRFIAASVDDRREVDWECLYDIVAADITEPYFVGVSCTEALSSDSQSSAVAERFRYYKRAVLKRYDSSFNRYIPAKKLL